MIGLSRLKRAITDVPTGGMQTGTSKVQLKLCDAQRIEVEYGALTAERDAALAQNAELEAENSALRIVMQNFHPDTFEYQTNDFDLGDDVMEVLAKTPSQHLRDIQAEAGRAGFMGCVKHYEIDDAQACIDEAADEYAEKVRRGEE